MTTARTVQEDTMTRPTVTTDLAKRLVRLAVEAHQAKPGKAKQIANARLDGATDVLDVLGFTMTPTSARLAITDALAAAGEVPPVAAKDRRAWVDNAAAIVVANLAGAI
jgi:hypothetical protein